MERKEFTIQGSIETFPVVQEIDMAVDVTDMEFGKVTGGQVSVVVSRIMTITGNSGIVNVSIGTTDWVGTEKVMAGNVTEVAVGSGPYMPLVVAGEVGLGQFTKGEHILNFRITPPEDIDLNVYNQKVVIIGE